MNAEKIFVLWTALCGVSGCADFSEPSPASLGALAPRLAARHENLTFVQSAAAGFELATERRLPCLVFFAAEWCTFCRQMEDTAFKAASVAALAENFVCVRVDADRESHVCQQFGVSGYPTVQFVSSDGRTLYRLEGLQSTSELVQGMQTALQRYAWLGEAESDWR
ncbi:MAG: protein disulfide isomerase family protein [Pirellulales bacterium]|nr:protein disulfide isomerase family protein [Pirellulales bacterium]